MGVVMYSIIGSAYSTLALSFGNPQSMRAFHYFDPMDPFLTESLALGSVPMFHFYPFEFG